MELLRPGCLPREQKLPERIARELRPDCWVNLSFDRSDWLWYNAGRWALYPSPRAPHAALEF